MAAKASAARGRPELRALTSVPAFNPDTRFGWGNRPWNCGVLDQRAARADAARRHRRRLLPPLVRQLPGDRQPGEHRGRLRSVTASPRRSIRGCRTAAATWSPASTTSTRAKFGLVDNYTTFASDFGEQTETWNGVDLSVNARLQNGVMLQGGFSTGRTVTDNCEVAAKAGTTTAGFGCCSSTTRRSSIATTSATS